MREICTSGSTRGQWVARTVAHCPTLPANSSSYPTLNQKLSFQVAPGATLCNSLYTPS